ncbi:protein phosphatase 2C domain-containing protein, partial [Corynebacterium sp.]
MSLALNYTARSDRGLIRQNNEDSAYAGSRLLALADGMGGHAAGEIASQLMIAAVSRLDNDQPGPDLLESLRSACMEGNNSIADEIEQNPSTQGMGTTLTALLFDGTRLGMCHVGDSRGYLLRDGELIRITRDDTYVQSLVDEGNLTEEEAAIHPQRSLILKALTGRPVEPTLSYRDVHEGDRYLLCSDGLSDPVSADTIKDVLSEGTPDEA